jgi:oligosaccharide repeat unit polymerase
MTWFFLFLAAAIALRVSSLKKDFFSPAVFFTLLFSFLLAIVSLHLTPIQTPWSSTTHLLFWSSLALYLCGCAIIYALFHVKKPLYTFSFSSIRAHLKEDALKLDWNRLWWVWLLCVGIFLASFFAALVIYGNLPILANNPNEARLKFFSASTLGNYGMHFGPLSLMLGCEMLLFMPRKGKSVHFISMVLLIVFALYATIVTRVDIIRTILFCFVLVNYGRKTINLKHIGLLAGFGLLLFFSFSFIRFSQSAAETLVSTYQFQIPKQFAWCVTMYVYIANNFWNFDYAVQKFIDCNQAYNFGYGFNFFRGFYFLAKLEDPIVKMFGFDNLYNASITKVHGLNTVLFPWHFFTNFGYFGIFFFSLLMGLLVSLYYRNTFLHATLFRTVMWALVIGVLFVSYMVPYWEFWMLYMNVIVFAIAHGKIKGFA